jgi:hypothetical protein
LADRGKRETDAMTSPCASSVFAGFRFPRKVIAAARVLDELTPAALHTVRQYANNPVETDHGRLKTRLRHL